MVVEWQIVASERYYPYTTSTWSTTLLVRTDQTMNVLDLFLTVPGLEVLAIVTLVLYVGFIGWLMRTGKRHE